MLFDLEGLVEDPLFAMMLADSGGRAPTYPATGAAATTLLGLTLTSLYLCQEASGNLADSVGANTLVAANTPTFQRALPDGRLGVYYDAAGDKHVADVWTLGSTSAVMMAVFEAVADLGGASAGIIGRFNAGGASDGVDVSLDTTTGVPRLLLRDTGSNTLNVAGATNVRSLGGLWLAQLQVDRAGTTGRARFSRWTGGVAPIALSGSIAGFAALDGVLSMESGLGSYGARVGGNAVSWAAVATGAQCEGAGLLAANAVAMGFE